MDKLIEISLELSDEEIGMVLHALEIYSLDMVAVATVSGSGVDQRGAYDAHEAVESIIRSIEFQAGLEPEDNLDADL